MKPTFSIIAASIITIFSTACSQTEKAEQASADMTAEQMMDAKIAGREMARHFVNRQWTDTPQMQNDLLEAKARQSEYIRAGHPEKAQEFDSAFISTIRTVNPGLANEITARRRANL